MSNTINPAGISSYQGLNQVRQKNALKSAVHTGQAAHTGKKETEKKEPSDSFDGVKKFFKYQDGRTLTTFEDGSTQLKAPNGAMRDVDAEGNKTVTLPNGMMVEHKKDEAPKVYDPVSGQYSAVDVEGDKSKQAYKFRDAEGNTWKAWGDALKFEVTNSSESLTQKVGTDGGVEISTKTLSRDPVAGRFSQDSASIHISPDGTVTDESKNLGDIALNNKHLGFTARNDINMGIKLPYSLPQNLKGKCVKPDLPPPTQEPNFPPPGGTTPGHGHPGHGHPGHMPGGMPGGIPGGTPGWNADPWQQFPWQGFPMPGPMPPMPGTGQTPPANDPYSAVMTPSGLMRKAEPDGSMFVSLPNGIVMNQMPDGKCQAFDSRFPGKTLPVSSQPVENPGFGPETRYTFQDGAGNLVTLYNKSMDFQVASKDGNVVQNVAPNGDMMINARTYPVGENGQPTPKTHKVLIGADGRVNTFGEKGVQVNNRNLVFAENGHITNYALPYEIPLEQGLMPSHPPVGYYPPGQIPVPDPMKPCPNMGNMPGGIPPQKPDMPPTEGKETKTSDAAAGEGAAKGEKPETPSEKPVKPGMWQKIKNFFNGESNETGKTGKAKHHGHCQGNNWCGSYPGGYYNPYGGMGMGMMGSGAMIGLGIGATAMLSGMMMPMGMWCNPFGMYGMYGMW